ncbi:MFS transporter [Methylobacterium sp. CCH7-A2]|uniref:MFS transporter n=1 Tax=Methylobacterium sp. CCH7-A2 TaxID=1768789 RepID=UPI00082ECD5E|nr:MFS transporter [Methylobacterium sp. CCH7-A2]
MTGPMPQMVDQGRAGTMREGSLQRAFMIATMAFLTLIDLFAMQAVLPSLSQRYGVGPAAMGLAVNASTLGMAVSSLATSFLSQRIDRRWGVVVSLALLAVPTMLLAGAPDLSSFAVLRVLQGVCMAAAFTLMLTYLGEHYSADDSASAFAAYIAGNVASNLIGRLMSSAVTDHFGLNITFYVFAALNLVGAVMAFGFIARTQEMAGVARPAGSAFEAVAAHLANPGLRASFAIGFLILFAFIGTFTYVNFVLVAAPLSLGMMQVGLVYFVFAPSIVTTLLAGALARRIGPVGALWLSLALAGTGLPLLVVSNLPTVLAGLVLVAVGTFAAQAVATGLVGRAAKRDRGAASGLYLASYFAGGLAGSAVLGQIFDRFGWSACVAGIGMSLALAALLAFKLRPIVKET